MDERASRFVDLRSAALWISSARSRVCRNSKIGYSAAQNVPQRSVFHVPHRPSNSSARMTGALEGFLHRSWL